MSIMNSRNPLTGRAVLFWLLGFFGLVIAVNGAFIYFAEHSFPGLSAQNAYEVGLAYNRVLESSEAQRQLGWRVTFGLDSKSGTLELRISDADGRPVESPLVAANVRRPAEAADDQHVSFTRSGPGVYSALHALPAPGNWNVTVRVERAAGDAYVIEQRFWMP